MIPLQKDINFYFRFNSTSLPFEALFRGKVRIETISNTYTILCGFICQSLGVSKPQTKSMKKKANQQNFQYFFIRESLPIFNVISFFKTERRERFKCHETLAKFNLYRKKEKQDCTNSSARNTFVASFLLFKFIFSKKAVLYILNFLGRNKLQGGD